MSDLDLAYTSATKLAGMIREGRISSAEAVGNALARIDEVNGVLNCFCFVYGEEALDLARAADQRLARIAAALEAAVGWPDWRPPQAAG